jgi:hypothetical protein
MIIEDTKYKFGKKCHTELEDAEAGLKGSGVRTVQVGCAITLLAGDYAA